MGVEEPELVLEENLRGFPAELPITDLSPPSLNPVGQGQRKMLGVLAASHIQFGYDF